MRWRVFPIVLAVLALAAAGSGCGKKEVEAYRTEPVTRGAVSEVVNATGDVQAIVTVNVGSQVSGTIDKLAVDFNSKVKKGQLLATLDARLFQAQLEKADAGLASAMANVERTRVQLEDSDRQLKRLRSLLDQRLVASSDVDTAAANRDAAAAQLAANKAAVLQARADRTLAATNLAFTKITSPIDGIVVSRAIDIGQTVAAAFQAPTLFTIANDLTKMQILANIDEADVGKVHEGQDASFTVDAYPGEQFRGKIREVRQAPTTIQNVVTYAAVIDAPNPERKLRQGMTAAVTVVASRHEDVARVPNGALRWKPADFVPPEGGRGGGGSGGSGGANANGGAGGGIGSAHAASGGAGGRAGGAGREGRGAAVAADEKPIPGVRPGRVFKLEGGRPVAVALRLGISDGQRTEVVDGLAEGDQVITGELGGAAPKSPAGGQRRGPF